MLGMDRVTAVTFTASLLALDLLAFAATALV